MQIFNSKIQYGLLAKLFHWITFTALIIQVPFGFYLVGLEFSDRRINLENIHSKIQKEQDIFDRGHDLKRVELDSTFPDYILDNKEKFKKWLV